MTSLSAISHPKRVAKPFNNEHHNYTEAVSYHTFLDAQKLPGKYEDTVNTDAKTFSTLDLFYLFC